MEGNQAESAEFASRPSSVSENVSEPVSQSNSISSSSTAPPPTPHDIDRWSKHISLQEFGESLQSAARALFPNETKSRYTSVTVLVLSWQDEDPNLPVSLEISRLVDVFRNIYHFGVDEWKIPNQNSHWAVNQKIMTFVAPGPNDREHLKIVYYAGHGRLTKTRLLEWISWQDKPRSRSRVQPVQWSGIQVLLEQAESDVLILLDCCAAGTANAGGGSGVTELIAACAFNATANGVGPHSFTNALVIELTELSRKPSFSIGELYSNIFIRTQCRIPEHGRERHPAPIHLVLTQQIGFSRSIQLSARYRSQAVNEQLPALSTTTVSEGSPELGSSAVYPNRGRGPNTSHLNGIETASNVPPQTNSMMADQQITTFDDRVPRLLFAVRIKETFQPSELSTDLFSEWLRFIPLLIEEVKVEAGFDSFSSILIVSLPIALSSYIPTNPAVMCLGPIR
ncbi:hypothetical protein BGZ57DRAFT_828993, partial [Hyaloscypha finlandica]